MRKFYLIILYIVLISLGLPGSAKAQELDIEQLDRDYSEAIKTYNVPGMSVAIVSSDSILLQKGYGVLSTENTQPVDKNTIFGIASLSKTFTSALVIDAVSNNKFDFDTKIKELYPSFQLYDPYVTSEITIADALSHRSGLTNFSGDLIWYGSKIDDSTIIHRLKYLQPQYGFRTHFGYSNIFYLLVGNILENIYHNSYAALVDSIIAKPLKMENTLVKYEDVIKKKNLAIPHVEKNDELLIQPYLSWNNMNAAGGVFSSVADLSKYLQMWLNKGVYHKKKILPEEQIKELWMQKTPTKLSWIETYLGSPVNFRSFGMGWAMLDYAGYKVMHHSGGLDGMVCHMVIIPDKDIGAVFLTNKTTALPTVLMYHLMDKLLGNGEKDYISAASDLMKKFKDHETEPAPFYAAPKNMKPNFYAGTYYDSLIGEVKIEKNLESYKIDWLESNIFKGDMVQTDMLTFTLNWNNIPSLPEGRVIFDVDGSGRVKGFEIELPNPDLHFNELYFSRIDE